MCANSRPEQVQQTEQLLDDLVGAGEQRRRDFNVHVFRILREMGEG